MPQTNQIPFVTLPNWIRAAAECGFQIDPLFERLGIKPDLIHLQQATISIEAMDELMLACVQACRQASPDRHFPFVLGESFSFEYLPEIETYISTSANLREAAKALQWVRELVNPYIDLRLTEQGRLAWIHLKAGQEPVQGSAMETAIYYIESVQPTVLKFARMLLGKQARFRILRFRHPPPEYAAMYEAYFHIPVAFNQDYDGIEFDRELLDLPLQGAFPSLHEQAEYLVEQRVARLPQRQGLAAQVKELLESQPEQLNQGIEHCADALGLHPRSLQRRLRQEETQYAELLDEVRFGAAIRALQAGQCNLETLSETLGFADRRSFTRAFKRWSGCTPSQYRQNLQS